VPSTSRVHGLGQDELEARLSDFDAGARREALGELARRAGAGAIDLPPAGGNVNLHVHSFFSFNADGHSPSRVAWEARKRGLLAAGIVDFDVLDGLEEFLAAGDLLGLRATVGVESRVFVRELADREINSPGEPGIAYFMGTGFFRPPEPGIDAAATLDRMRALARRRNEEMLDRINRHLGEAAVDYERDVLPLAPSGNATERHMLAAYESKGAEVFADEEARARYWAGRLGEDAGRVRELLADSVAFRELLRARLMKKGGVGYAPPERGSFPALEDMIAMTRACEALPCPTWLDGTTPGEEDPEELVRSYVSKGAVALNLIPDRNWRVKDPAARRRKIGNLYAIVEAARAAGLVLVHGTERNKHGLPFVDDLGNEALAPIAETLREGAYALFGHTAMARFASRPLAGEWAEEVFGGDAKARNRFYAEVGRLLEPRPESAARLRAACEAEEAEAVVASLR
jgi:hypothetical protein